MALFTAPRQALAALLLLALAPLGLSSPATGLQDDSLAEMARQTEAFQARVDGAPARIAALAEAEGPASAAPGLEEADELELPEVEARAQGAREELDAARATLRELNVEITRRADRLAALPEEIARLVTETARAEGVGTGAEAGEGLELARGRAAMLRTERLALEAERELLDLRLDAARLRVASAQDAAAFWNEQAKERQEREEARQLRLRERALARILEAHPGLAGYEGRELELRRRQVGEESLPERIAAAREEVTRLENRTAEVVRLWDLAHRRVTLGGLGAGMGQTLQLDLERLETTRELGAADRKRVSELGRLALQQMELEEERAALGDINAEAARLVESVPAAERTEGIEEAARDLVRARRREVDQVRERLDELSDVIVEQRVEVRRLRVVVDTFRGTLEGMILFVRSAEPIGLDTLAAVPRDAASLVQQLTPVVSGARERLRETRQESGAPGLPRAISALVGLLMLVVLRRTLRARREEIAGLVRSFRTDRFTYTLQALLLTALLALPGPFVLASLASFFPFSAASCLPRASEDLLLAVRGGLLDTALLWWVLGMARGITADDGLGCAHFRWPLAGMAFLRRELRWFTPSILVTSGLSSFLSRQHDAPWHESIGRLVFTVAMVLLAVFSQRVLPPETELWRKTDRSAGSRGLLVRTHRLWAVVAVALPLVLLVLAFIGYDYTAHRLETRLWLSWLFALVVALINAMLLRWLFIARRRLAVEQAIEAKERRAEEAAAGEVPAEDTASAALDADKVNIPAIDAQTRQLFKTSITLASVVGLFLIWAGVLPALQAFDRVQLYPSFEIVEDSSLARPPATSTVAAATVDTGASSAVLPVPGASGLVGASATSPAPAEGIPSSLTLADLMLAALFVMLTSVAARNVPALLELTILRKLPLDGGERYAISTISRYVILIVGVSLISGALHIGWAKIQWLAAALTFGLAFGLQEIFANFVSGLIILIERPVRVGDVVTVGDVHGRVTQLRMRATTILDWDRKEMLVPNKEFITNAVTNWTLSDPKTRVIVPVGVAYGSDTRLARDLLLKVASESRLVISDPAPIAIFKGFGDSTLDLELRVFTDNRDLWPNLLDELHSKIDEAFRAEDIEIAFPQRDLHIRSGLGKAGSEDAGLDQAGNGPGEA